MISLAVKPYCNNCAYFEPEKSGVMYAGEISYVEVMCENKRKCDNIEAYLKYEMEKEAHDSHKN